MPKKDDSTKRDSNALKSWISPNVPIIISIMAIIISIIGPGSISDFFYPGNIELQNSVGYAIINKSNEYCVILPIDWINTNKNTKIIISDIYLNISLDNKLYKLLLEGEYPSISTKAFSEDYKVIHSLILEPNSVSGKILVFKFNNSKFYIDSGLTIKARIAYKSREVGTTRNIKSNEVMIIDLPILNFKPDIRFFSPSTHHDFWYYRDLRPI